MAKNKKPRKKYRPKPLMNPLIVVADNIRPVARHDDYLINLQLYNSAAMYALTHGTATRKDMDAVIAMNNICVALCELGFGKEHAGVATDAREAIIAVAYRALKLDGRFVPTGQEIQALNTLMELHDAQMDAITVKDMENALKLAKSRMGRAFKLPSGHLNTVDTITKEPS